MTYIYLPSYNNEKRKRKSLNKKKNIIKMKETYILYLKKLLN